MVSDEEIGSLARKFAYFNAIDHDGVASLGAVVGRILSEFSDLRKDAVRVKSIVSSQIAFVNQKTLQEQKLALEKEFPGEWEVATSRKKEIAKSESLKKPELPDLPDAVTGKVVTRFPPEPNGFMHIGHAKALLLSLEYSKKYDGKFIVRFDDTNPAAEKFEYYGAFLESFDWLGITPDLVKNASDDMPKFYQIAEQMIQKFAAYVCSCSQERMREYRSLGLHCEHRSQSSSTNLSKWQSMLSGKADARNSTLRFVGNMQSLNTTMRDPVLFRIVEESHPLKKDQYRVWPTYDFDGPIEDSLDGVTHAMRSKEYELRDELYYAILDSLDLRKPKVIEFSRLALKDTTVSKRSLRKLIEEGKVQGWDDPRLPTIVALRRKGILAESIKEFILEMGISKVESLPTWDLLESINRKLLDPLAKRYFFVADPIKLEIDQFPQVEVNLRYHPEKDLGSRVINTNGRFLISGADSSELDVGSRFRLIEAYNCEVYSNDDGLVRARRISTGTEDRIPKIQWVSAEESIPLSVMKTGSLLINEEYNPDSLKIAEGFIERSAKELNVGDLFQLVRFGFCRLDSPSVAILANR
jgi:glutamyl-tRNA synthetase